MENIKVLIDAEELNIAHILENFGNKRKEKNIKVSDDVSIGKGKSTLGMGKIS